MPWVFAQDLPDPKLSKKEEAELEAYVRSKKRKLRFYIDADVPRQAVEILRERGLNILTAAEVRRKHDPDENHLAKAQRENRILITCDRDYLNERKFPLNQCPVLIVVCDFGTRTEEQILDTFQCLAWVEAAPGFFDKWVKIDANPSEWREKVRFQEGYVRHYRHRLHQGRLQVWVDDPA
jgi:predicted nuclease of predicted toxin-antitoxin system